MDFASALQCAEAVGAMQFANDTKLEYLKTRKQFGQPIGAFQALQHRMVEMFVTAEQARSMSYLACSKVDTTTAPVERGRIVSAAKIKIADACRQISQESIQLHGGMGMTEEMKVSHTFRRLTTIGQQFGDVDHHLDRFADLWNRYDLLRGKPVAVLQGTRRLAGTAAGIDDAGSLIIRDERGRSHRFTAGEVTLEKAG